MIRRLLRAHGDLLMNATFCAIAIGFLLLGYGDRQQTDAQSTPYPTCEGCGKTAVAAKQ